MAKMGRPALPVDQKRVVLNVMVDPETIAALDIYATDECISRGRAVDAAAKALKSKKIKR